MSQINVTVRVEVVESDGHSFAVEEYRPSHSGDNPGFFAQEVEHAVDGVTAKVQKAISDRFGDLRKRA